MKENALEGLYVDERANLIVSNMKLVYFVAKRFYRKGRIVQFEDIVQSGMVGLVKAADQFDHERGTKFSTYASMKILSEILNYFRTEHHTIRAPKGKDKARITQITENIPAPEQMEKAEDLAEAGLLLSIIERTLNPMEKLVVLLRLGFFNEIPMTFVDIGPVMGLSSSGAHRLYHASIMKIKKACLKKTGKCR